MDKNIFDENLRMYGGRYEIGYESFDYLLESLITDSQAFIKNLINENANLPEVYIDYINSERANACAFKVDNKFYIGIMKGTVAKMKVIIQQLLDEIMDVNFHTLKYNKRSLYEEAFLILAFRFIVLHEYGHIVNGHIDWKKNNSRDSFFFENYTESNIDSNIDRQTREMNADRFAAKSSIDNIFKNGGFRSKYFSNTNIDKIAEALVCLYSAAYIMFLIFMPFTYDEKNFHMMSHPHPAIRQSYTITTTMNEYVFDEHDFEMDLSSYMNIVQGDYEKIAIKLMQLRNEFINPLKVPYTKLGWEHMLRIHNNWEKVRKQLTGFNYTKLEEFERMDYYFSSI